MVKSARTKKFNDEIDLIFKNRIYTGRFNHYILIIVQNLGEFQTIQVMCST